jgi:tRNA isopentenyl-2-thiomethyl-A-37 hydroxylase MiaE
VLTIVNPSQIEVPGDRARLLLVTTCRVVAEEFHRRPEEVELTMTLVMGARDEHYSIDKASQMTMYLDQWDEGKFVDGVITSVVQRLAPLHLRNQMFTEILRRTDRIAPVSAKQLRVPGTNAPLHRGATSRSCISAVSVMPCPWPTQPQQP